MRIAVMIIALCLTLIVGLQSCTIYAGASLIKDQASAGGGALGILLAFLFVLGAAFALGLPRLSMVCFSLAALAGLAAASTSGFRDMYIWASLSLVLAGMSYFGSRELRKKKLAGTHGQT